jgi:hypothetical protein
MPRYFFHLRERQGTTPDIEGMDLPDRNSAVNVALRGARSVLCDEVMEGCLDLDGAVHVTDEEGRDLFTISFSEAVAIPSR